MRLLPLVIGATMFSSIALAAEKGPPAGDDQLVYALYVVRHGVRSPTGDPAQYLHFSSAVWPKWPVPPGYLTTHGYEVIRELGVYDRNELAKKSLLSPSGCSDVDRVSIHADSDQRTRETAKALAEGMFPGCKVAVNSLQEGANDPLFHLSSATASREQAKAATAALLNRIGDDPKTIAAAYHVQLADLDKILADCGTVTSSHLRTSIFDVPASVAQGNDDHMVAMKGPLNTASTLTENLLLEYAEGMPDEDVGWGCVNGTKLRKLISLHTEASDLTQRTPAVAVPQALALVRAIDRSLMQAATGRPVPGAEGKPGDKVLLLVGHDTNLNNFAGALGFHWVLDGRRDDTPPGSGFVFELWKNQALKTYSVRMFFTTQTLEQMRNATPLTSSDPPQRVSVSLPTCSETEHGCDLSSFEHALERASASNDEPKQTDSPHRDHMSSVK